MLVFKEFSSDRIEEVKDIYKGQSWQAYLRDDDKLLRALKASIYLMGAFYDDKLLGFIRCLGDGEHLIVVQDLIVRTEYQKRGIGKRLLELASEKYKDVRMFYLITDSEDINANKFYKKFGLIKLEDGGMVSYFRPKESKNLQE